jgi:hypothetical protein
MSEKPITPEEALDRVKKWSAAWIKRYGEYGRYRVPIKNTAEPVVGLDKPLVGDLIVLAHEVERVYGLIERLSAVTVQLDFDATESALPETQEQWIEWVRAMDERADKIMEEY